MESIRVFFRKLHLFPVFILVLGRGGKVFGKSLATLKTYIEEPTEKIRKQKKPLDFFFSGSDFSDFYLCFFLSRLFKDAQLNPSTFRAPGCIDPGWFLFIYSIILFWTPSPLHYCIKCSFIYRNGTGQWTWMVDWFLSRWWFQIFFSFTYLGKIPNLTNIFRWVETTK